MNEIIQKIIEPFEGFSYNEEDMIITNVYGGPEKLEYLRAIFGVLSSLRDAEIRYDIDEKGDIHLSRPSWETHKSFAVSLDTSGNIIELNAYAYKISGYSAHEVMGKNWFDIFIPDIAKAEIHDVFRSLLDGSNTHHQHINEILLKDGSRKNFRWLNTVLHDKKNKPIYICSVGMPLD